MIYYSINYNFTTRFEPENIIYIYTKKPLKFKIIYYNLYKIIEAEIFNTHINKKFNNALEK